MADANRKLEVVIAGDSRQLERAFSRSARASESFGKRVQGGAVKSLKAVGLVAGGALVVGVGAAAIGLKKAADAAAEAEASNARLRGQLKAMGKDNQTVRTNIDKTVQSLSGMSGWDDEDLQDSFTTLMRTTGNVKKSQSELSLVSDIARGKQISLSAATNIVNRANVGSLGALKKLGIQVDKNMTKEQAFAMLRKKFAGQTEAYAKTAKGAQDRLAVGMENAYEQIGVALLPAINAFADFSTNQLPGIAKAVSQYLGQAIAWLKQNWPQIRAVLQSVWDWYQTYIQTILVPAMKGLIAGIGEVIGFVRDHMPEIRSAMQSVFDWINTNIVPTVKTLAMVVGTVVRAMTGFWRDHAQDIKNILGPVFETIKTVIVGALSIIVNTVKFWLAIFRGDFDAAGTAIKSIVSSAFGMIVSVATMQLRVMAQVVKIAVREITDWFGDRFGEISAKVSKAFDDVKTSITNASTSITAAAFGLGRDMIHGVINGIGSLAGWLRDRLWGTIGSAIDWAKKVLGINSPSKFTMEQLGIPMVDGIAVGVRKNKGKIAKGLADVLTSSVQSARGNLGGLTGGLAGMLGRINDVQIGAMTSTGSLTGGKTLAEIRSEQDRVARVREKQRLEDAVRDAETDEERKQAQQDLDDWKINEEARVLEESMTKRQRSYDDDIANLTDSFNRGLISAQTFQDQLRGLIGENTGTELGTAFADAFGKQVAAVMQQINDLAAFAGIATGAPGSESPAAAVGAANKAGNEERWKAAHDAWVKRRKAYRDQLESAKKTVNGKKVAKYTAKQIDDLMHDWIDDHAEPKRADYALAKGGILRKTVFAAGEAGPEALIPLGSSKAKSMLADAVANGGGSTGGTVINVTVNGNEFSAREFADKLAPELRRRVSMTRSA